MKKAAKRITKTDKTFSEEERTAMRERALELKSKKLNGEDDLLAKIAMMPEPDRGMARRLHALIMKNAPGLKPKTWYGMPAYANKDNGVVCFFQSAKKFQTRYSTINFGDHAKLDEGNMWPTSFALKKLTATEETVIVKLLKKAVG